MTHKYRIISLMKEVLKNGAICSAHSTCSQVNINKRNSLNCDYAFEMACSNLRYGPGVTKELGMDAINFNSKRALLITDKNVSKLPTFKICLDSLTKYGVNFDVYDEVNIEPTNTSIIHAVNFSKNLSDPYDLFIAFGGGSTIDTCKIVNLLSADKEANLMDYVAIPIGKGKNIRCSLKPMIAIPTTSGTGSETTGVAIFDLKSLKAKVGISQRALRPTLGLVDPDHTAYLPRDVACYSGFDVLCHALESYTAIPYNLRSPRPRNPIDRPAYQGSNPISDIWALHALRIVAKYFRRSVNDALDSEARSQMHFASALAGMGFGNAGVHLCHGLSYVISGLSSYAHINKNDYKPVNNDVKCFIPHGLSVVVTAPAVFKFTSKLYTDRHKLAANILSKNEFGFQCHNSDGGDILSDIVLKYMNDLKVPDGLHELGFTLADIPKLVEGTIPQHRTTKLSPLLAEKEDLYNLFENSMKIY